MTPKPKTLRHWLQDVIYVINADMHYAQLPTESIEDIAQTIIGSLELTMRPALTGVCNFANTLPQTEEAHSETVYVLGIMLNYFSIDVAGLIDDKHIAALERQYGNTI